MFTALIPDTLRFALRTLFVSLGTSLFALSLADCGESREHQSLSTSVAVHRGTLTGTTVPHSTQRLGYLNDGDEDPSNDEDLDDADDKTSDEDHDPRQDHIPTQNHSYHDSDDDITLSFGSSASVTEEQKVTRVVMLYLAAAIADNGAKMCSLMSPTFASAGVEDYGRPPGPPALRGDSCSMVITKVFKYSPLTSAFQVTGIRVAKSRGIALLASRTMPASKLPVGRDAGAWKVVALTPVPLP
jgi:hypothetical protein